MRTAIFVAALLLALVAIATACAESSGPGSRQLLWSGSFAGEARAWSGVQAEAGGFEAVPAPGGRAGLAGHFVVHPGDVPIGASGERAEVYYETGEREGVESFWRWSAYFPSSGRSSPETSWNVFTQWHQSVSGGVQPLSFEITNRGSREWFHVRSWGGDAEAPTRRDWRLASVERDRWYDFALRVRWASDGNGLLEVWLDGRRVIGPVAGPTLYRGEDVYIKQGYYRGVSDVTSEVYIAGTQRGRSLADVGVDASAPPAPRSLSRPTLRGALRAGAVLTASPGRWSPAPTRIRYRWQVRQAAGPWTTLKEGAVRTLPVSGRIARAAVRVEVVATNGGGTSVATSVPLGRRVAGAPPPAKTATGQTGPPSISQSIRAGAVLGGVVVWTVTPSSPVKEVVFAMDSNAETHVVRTPPYRLRLDTTRYPDGRHTLGLTVTLLDGTVVWKPYQIGTVTFRNDR